MSSIHTSEACGHGGIFYTLNLLQQDYWWPGMTTYIQKYIARCSVCQANKVNIHSTIPALFPLKSDCIHPFQQVSVDFITNLPPSGSFDSVMVIVDHMLTKGVILCPCNKNINMAGVAKLFFLHVFCHYGLHNKCISDQGPQFASAFARELTHLLKYDLKLSSVYHPQTNEETERVNQELETYLHIFCDGHPEKWADLLPMTESKDSLGGRLVIRSTETCWKGQVQSDFKEERAGMVGWVLTLFAWQTVHLAIYFQT